MEEGKNFGSLWLFAVWALLVVLSLAGSHSGEAKGQAGAKGRSRLLGAISAPGTPTTHAAAR